MSVWRNAAAVRAGAIAPRTSLSSAPVLDEIRRHMHEGFDGLYGLQVTAAEDGRVSGEIVVRDDLKQPAGLVHGGVYAAMAESLASLGTAVAVMADGRVAMGLSNLTSFLRPITAGTIHGEAVAQHRGRTTWVWEVRITDDAGRLCVLTRMTVAVRELPGTADPAAG